MNAIPRSAAALALLLGALSGCSETPTDPASPDNPAFVISDGAHGGNPHVFFLPPMLPDPSASFSADFDGKADVTIGICVWGVSAGSCGATIATFSRTTGSGSELLRIPSGEEYFLVNWHTRGVPDRFRLHAGEVYRIRVLVGQQELAFADVEFVRPGRARRPGNEGAVLLTSGQTLPIKVRIEEGWEEYGAVEVLEAGGWHTCSLTSAGAAYCWGYGEYGQLGNSSTTLAQTTPVAVAGNHVFTALSAGQFHTCGLTAAGTAWCWGYNSSGQLGNNTRVNQSAPVAVSGNLTFAALSAGGEHTCGLTPQGAAWCWGSQFKGQIGKGPIVGLALTPVAVVGGLTFTALSAGGDHTCGITTDGSAWCWGYGGWGQLGTGSQSDQYSPAPVSGGLTFAALSAGGRGVFWGSYEQTCGLTHAGATYCWGRVGYFLNGNRVIGPVLVPILLPSAPTFVTLDVSGEHGCGLTAAGSAYCWGNNTEGQLGTGGRTLSITPVAVSGGHTFAALSVGVWHSCGVTTAGGRLCWGYGDEGALGTGNTADALAPVTVLAPPGGW